MPSDKLKKDQKRELQFERIILFSDAVFAIAITLLIIDIKITPKGGEITDKSIFYELLQLFPNIFGFLLSFFVIGIYWTVHHRLFGYLTGYDNKLIWLNLLFLLSIVLMPFTTSFYSEYYQPNLILPYTIYTINLCLIGFCYFLIVKHISNPKAKISHGFDNPYLIKASYLRAIMMPVIFIFGLIISLIFHPLLGRFVPMLIPLYLIIVNRWYRKKVGQTV